MNSRFQNALRRVADSIPPVWFMRQAGRYHAHYRALRETHSFMELCKEPELAAQVALGPIADFDFDVAILFSDLLFPLEALGMGLSYTDGGPRLGWHLDSEHIKALADPQQALPQLQFQREALKLTRAQLSADKSLIGFVGGPFTLFAYAVEGTHGKGLMRTKKSLALYEPFCERLIPLLQGAIELQLAGGAEVVFLFDTAAGELAPALFRSVVWSKVTGLVRAFPGKVGYYAQGIQPAHLSGAGLQSLPLAGIGIDHRWAMQEAFALGAPGFVQGNFDQALLHCGEREFRRLLDDWLLPLATLSPEKRRGWVCGLGHGVLPATPEENVRYFVKHVREVFG